MKIEYSDWVNKKAGKEVKLIDWIKFCKEKNKFNPYHIELPSDWRNEVKSLMEMIPTGTVEVYGREVQLKLTQKFNYEDVSWYFPTSEEELDKISKEYEKYIKRNIPKR